MDNYNKKIVNELFNQKINKDKIYYNVLKNNTSNKLQLFKLSLVPICISIIIFCITIIVNKVDNSNGNVTQNNNKAETDEVYVNDHDGEENLIDVLGTCEDVTFNAIIKEQSSFSQIKFPDGAEEIRCMKLYELEGNTKYSTSIEAHKFRGKFLGYNMIFFTKEGSVDIFVSSTLDSRIRDMPIIQEDLKSSKILNKEIKILTYSSDKYIVLLESNDLYWDIETDNVSEEELIDMVKSIIRMEENSNE